jgi:hypothetical protein
MIRVRAEVVTLLIAGSFVAAGGRETAAQTGDALSNAATLVLSSPKAVVEVDVGKLKGQPAVMAWSPDASELYLQTVERDRRGAVTSAKHYVVNVTSKSIKSVGEEPAWASKYWTWKSAQASPALASFKIDIEERNETKRAVAAPVGGDLAKGGTSGSDRSNVGSTATDAAAAAYASQEQHIYALKTKGQIIGEWVNEPVTPGTNFGWAPAPARLIVFAKREGGPLVVLDDQGRKQDFEETKPASLPAFSGDATKLCWLQRTGRNKYDLMIADVSGHP